MSQTTTPKKRSAINMREKNKKKAKNFSSNEDVALCKAFVKVSSDPREGVGQKAVVFWNKVKIAFDIHIVEDEAGNKGRDSEALMNRFKRHIQKQTNSFNAIYRRVI
jgi:hypothetical protein